MPAWLVRTRNRLTPALNEKLRATPTLRSTRERTSWLALGGAESMEMDHHARNSLAWQCRLVSALKALPRRETDVGVGPLHDFRQLERAVQVSWDAVRMAAMLLHKVVQRWATVRPVRRSLDQIELQVIWKPLPFAASALQIGGPLWRCQKILLLDHRIRAHTGQTSGL
eukprot:scaffold25366_cov75-Phaeocystis_antarctica.AAC.2